MLCIALRIASDADHHDRMTVADVAGVNLPSFNFCREHERIETEIGTFVRQWIQVTSNTSPASGGSGSMPSPLALDPHCELRVLTLLSALGTRIQLFNTAIHHGRKAKFLDPIVYECREENISTAIDICDLLYRAEVLRPDKVSSVPLILSIVLKI